MQATESKQVGDIFGFKFGPLARPSPIGCIGCERETQETTENTESPGAS